MYRYNLSKIKSALPVTWILIPKSRESTDEDDDNDDLKTRKMGLEYYFRLVCNASTFSQSRLFVYSAMMALTICTSAIVFHVSHHSCRVTLIPFWIKCAEGPHQLCDLIFYRVLPLFDCVYVCGAIFGGSKKGPLQGSLGGQPLAGFWGVAWKCLGVPWGPLDSMGYVFGERARGPEPR